MSNKMTMTFETALKKLEQIVQEMEDGELPLEKAIGKFEEGIRLSRFCSGKLDESEKRIQELMETSAASVQSDGVEEHR